MEITSTSTGIFLKAPNVTKSVLPAIRSARDLLPEFFQLLRDNLRWNCIRFVPVDTRDIDSDDSSLPVYERTAAVVWRDHRIVHKDCGKARAAVAIGLARPRIDKPF